MFTGIIHYSAKVADIKKQKSGNVLLSFSVPAEARKRLHVDDSVSINGVCLTVTKLSKNGFVANVMPETLRLSTLGSLQKGELVNTELSLRVNDSLGGHFVMGHVDGMGKVVKLKIEGDSLLVTIQVLKELMAYISKKGSIGVNGVSLTVTDVTAKTFGVALIPHTLAKTNLGALHDGSKVNIEIDTFARIIGQYLDQRNVKK
jgi:riboflavin synthase